MPECAREERKEIFMTICGACSDVKSREVDKKYVYIYVEDTRRHENEEKDFIENL